MGSVLAESPSPRALRHRRLRGEQGGVRALTPRRRRALRGRTHPVQPARAGSDRHADGGPGRRATRRSAAYLATKQPMAGGPGSAEDVAEAALYLCEPASRFVTGRRAGRRRRLAAQRGADPPMREPAISDVLAQYLAAVREALDAIEATSSPRSAQAAATVRRGRSWRAGWSTSSARGIRGWPSRRCSRATARSRASTRSSSCR